jgi:hypothetical protein
MRSRIAAAALAVASLVATSGCHIHFSEPDADIRLCAQEGRRQVDDSAIATKARIVGATTSHSVSAECEWFVEDHGHFHCGRIEFDTHLLYAHVVGRCSF